MPCFKPLKGFRSRFKNKNGNYPITFKEDEAFFHRPVTLPCSQCIGCRLERSRQWAMRCVHEASLYENNCFITLTYNNDKLPADGSLNLKHFQDFMKRLRKKYGSGIRFFHCGEYGERFFRPHYHACLFNHDFNDREFFTSNNGVPLYTSESLDSLWCDPVDKKSFGFATVGDVTFDSAAYVARYIMKKVTGDLADFHYFRHLDVETGELLPIKPEYITMSRRPGIGKEWLDSFIDDVYPSDFVTLNGRKMRPPKYYDTQYELLYPDEFAKLKKLRVKSASVFSDNNTPERLQVREYVTQRNLDLLIRPLDN